MTDACLPRSKAALGSLLDALDVEHRPEWQPGYWPEPPNHKPGVTWCNQAARAGLHALDVEVPLMLANDLQNWLDGPAGRVAGWEECTAQRAGDRAELGYPTVVTYQEAPHGHIAMVRGRDAFGNLRIWQAGRSNFSDGPLRAAFTVEQLQRVRFFTHD